MSSRSFDRSAFVEIFLQEASEHFDRANQGLLALEKEPHDRSVLNEVTRSIHTIKGGARMVALDDLNLLAHKIEDVLTAARDQNLPLSSDHFDLLFAALDGLGQLLRAPTPDTTAGVDLQDLCRNLEQASRGEVFAVPARVRGSEVTEVARVVKREGERQRAQNEPQPLVDTTSLPPSAPVTPVSQPPPEPVTSATPLRPSEEETLRLAIRKLEALANNVNEILIMHGRGVAELTQFRQVLAALQGRQKAWAQFRVDLLSGLGDADPARSKVQPRVEQLDRLDRNLWEQVERLWHSASDRVDRTQVILDDLRQEVMGLQMVPVSTIFNSFQRSVRDLAREHSKQVRLMVEGGETELDRRIIQRLRDPLIHMVRNAMDHGVEPPEERVQQGKPEEGILTLSAYQEGMRVFIELVDDGRGIDINQVKTTAIQKKVRTEDELAMMSDDEVLRLIFEEGFSTSERITETSGRGVGMDVVKTVVEGLDGDVSVGTSAGQGTKIALALPLTLALTRTLIVRGGDETLAIPSASVEDLIRVHAQEVSSLGGREAVAWRGQTISLVWLMEILGLNHNSNRSNGAFPVVVLRHGGNTMGFAVDELLTEQEVVVKGLGRHLRRAPNVAGATILGTGELVLILHPPDLVTTARSGAVPSARRGGTRVERIEDPKRVLLVEDSFVTREMERSLLEAQGLEVEVAVDGLEGFQKALVGQFDLVVTDVEMPRMDGFEMTALLRQRDETEDLPVIIVTSLEKEEHKRRGVEVGASAYIVKGAFDQKALLEAIERLIG